MTASRLRSVCLLALLVGGVPAARADQGRIPIFAPATLTQSGSYVLTRDLTITSAQSLTINADNVTVDLNGHTLSGVGSGARLIYVVPTYSGIRIENGRLSGGDYAIYAPTPAGSTLGPDLSLRHLEISGQTSEAVFVGLAGYFEMTSCTVKNAASGVHLASGTVGASVTGRFVGNQIVQVAGNGLMLDGSLSFLVKDNVFTEIAFNGVVAGNAGGGGAGRGALISRNVFNGAGTSSAAVQILANGSLVLDNVFNGFQRAVDVQSTGNRVASNLIAWPSGSVTSAIGIEVLPFSGGADRNVIELNTIKLPNGCGLYFGGGAHDNVYRTNSFRGGSLTNVCDSGTGNLDGGGNVY